MAESTSALSGAVKQTSSTNQPTTPSSNNVKTHFCRFTIAVERADDSQDRATAAHLECLDGLVNKSPDVIILDKNNKEISILSSKESRVYNARFEIRKVQSNPYRGKEIDLYVVVHSIRSTYSFIYLRSLLSDEVKSNHVSIHEHSWSHHEFDIVQLGFVQGVDPCNFLREQFIKTLARGIVDTNNSPAFQFNCHSTSPLFVDQSKEKFKTRAYAIECRRCDVQQLLQQLTVFNIKSPSMFKVVFYRLRTCNKGALFKQAILDQEDFLRDTRVIPIEGVSLALMDLFQRDLMKIEGVKEIRHHKKTFSHGRWNLLTDRHEFKDTIKEVQLRLPFLFEKYATPESLDLNQFPRLDFRNQQDSANVSDTGVSHVPSDFATASKNNVWKSPSSDVTHSLTSTTVLSETMDKVKEENTLLKQQLCEVQEKLTASHEAIATAEEQVQQQFQDMNDKLVTANKENQEQVVLIKAQQETIKEQNLRVQSLTTQQVQSQEQLDVQEETIKEQQNQINKQNSRIQRLENELERLMAEKKNPPLSPSPSPSKSGQASLPLLAKATPTVKVPPSKNENTSSVPDPDPLSDPLSAASWKKMCDEDKNYQAMLKALANSSKKNTSPHNASGKVDLGNMTASEHCDYQAKVKRKIKKKQKRKSKSQQK